METNKIETKKDIWELIPLAKGCMIQLRGEVDYHGAPEVRRGLLEGIGKYKSALVDLREVMSMDSAAIACLVEACQETRKAGGRFGLLGVSEPLLRGLRLSRLDQVFPMYSSLKEWLGK